MEKAAGKRQERVQTHRLVGLGRLAARRGQDSPDLLEHAVLGVPCRRHGLLLAHTRREMRKHRLPQLEAHLAQLARQERVERGRVGRVERLRVDGLRDEAKLLDQPNCQVPLASVLRRRVGEHVLHRARVERLVDESIICSRNQLALER